MAVPHTGKPVGFPARNFMTGNESTFYYGCECFIEKV